MAALTVLAWCPVLSAQLQDDYLSARSRSANAGSAGAGDSVRVAARGVTDCSGGEIYDDGVPENGYGWIATVTDGRYAQQFLPTEGFAYTELCVCWVRSGGDDTIDFSIQVYEDDGSGGAPGTSLGTVGPVQAAGVPNALPGQFYSYDISSLGLTRSPGDGPFLFAIEWDPSVDQQFFICEDESGTTPVQPGFGASDGVPTWTATSTLFPNHRAQLIRANGISGADVTLTKTGVINGSQITYTIDLFNNGPGATSALTVTDTLPAEVTYVSDTCGGSNVPPWTWNAGTLASGAGASCDITVSVDSQFTGFISNTATVVGDNLFNLNDDSDTIRLQFLGASIPTLGEVALASFVLLLLGLGLWRLRGTL